MGKTAGKSVFFARSLLRLARLIGVIAVPVFLFPPLFCAAQSAIQLRLLSSAGESIEEVAAGEPFQLVVTISGIKDSGVRPDIVGLEQFLVRSSGFSLTTVNGDSTAKFLYTAQCNKPGKYDVGPACFSVNGKKIESESVTVVIGDRTVARSQQPASSVEKKSYFLRVMLDKEQVFVGEPVRCAVRFYTARSGVSIHKIEKPDLPGFVERGSVDERTGTEVIAGINCAFKEWSFLLVPQEAGKKTIPAFCAHVERSHSFDSLFAQIGMSLHMMGNMVRIYSPAQTLIVSPLPAYDGPRPVIARQAKLSAAIEPACAKEGEGMVFSVRLSGDGDFESLDSFNVQNLPEHFKWYDSKQYLLASDQGEQAVDSGAPKIQEAALHKKQAKVFEFIVQGLVAGDYEIPAQECACFNPETQQLYTIKSSPVRVLIRPQPGFCKKETMRHELQESNEFSEMAHEDGVGEPLNLEEKKVPKGCEHDLQLNMEGTWTVREKRALPWWLIAFIGGLFLLWVCVRLILWSATRFFGASRKKNKKKNAVRHARAALKRLEKTHACSDVHQLFVHFFAHILSVQPAAVQEELINKVFSQAAFTEDEMRQWHSFFSQAAEYSFAAFHGVAAGEVERQKKFFRQAHSWLDRFERFVAKGVR